ncbi:unnamed protein product [Medioppia subpectinata]|uniref:Chromo domain-containing protein n=1 Tax=Medioppia subpectinata TaxID=1979941 RepID=A0A7R9KH97_9ACAR|nr:unnamed protein product [Medioppia subpectinata]CAG2103377.1 unnamed protein product [Medioppia subpectinata]
MPKNSHKFHENEKVLCFHGPLLYEAKVQKSQEMESKETKERLVHYFVHYLGWSKNWDEWVPEDRVCKVNDTSLQKQKELTDAQNKSNKNKAMKKKSMDLKEKEAMPLNVSISADKPKPKPATVPTSPTISSETKENTIVVKEVEGQRKKRIRLETTIDSADLIANKGQDIEIKIPDVLKQFLVDDCDFMNQKKLVRLPAKVSVNRIIEDYVKHRLNTKLSPSKESAVKEAVEAYKVYFNASLSSYLLYSFERNQFKDLIKESDDDSKSVHLISEHIHDFLKYLERNPSLFTPNEYESASADYLKKLS